MYRGYMRLLVGITITLILFLSVSSALPALAEENTPTGAGAIFRRLRGIAVPNEPGIDNPQPTKSPAIIAGRIVRAALTLIGLSFLILTFYGGSLYLTAGGNEETVKKAKNIIVRAMIGVLIVVFAGAITQFIITQVESPGGTDACTPGDSYPTTLGDGCDRPYTQTGLTCECY